MPSPKFCASRKLYHHLNYVNFGFDWSCLLWSIFCASRKLYHSLNDGKFSINYVCHGPNFVQSRSSNVIWIMSFFLFWIFINVVCHHPNIVQAGSSTIICIMSIYLILGLDWLCLLWSKFCASRKHYHNSNYDNFLILGFWLIMFHDLSFLFPFYQEEDTEQDLKTAGAWKYRATVVWEGSKPIPLEVEVHLVCLCDRCRVRILSLVCIRSQIMSRGFGIEFGSNYVNRWNFLQMVWAL